MLWNKGPLKCFIHNFATDSMKKWGEHTRDNFHVYTGFVTMKGIQIELTGKILKAYHKDGDFIIMEEKLQ